MKKLTVLVLAGGILIGCSPIKVVKLNPSPEAKYASSQIEPSIAINPNNTDQIIAGTVLNDFYYSNNGGKSWSSESMRSTYGVWGDPVLMFDTANTAYYFHLASYKKTSHLDRIVCQKATINEEGELNAYDFDEGTFTEPNGTKVQDKQWTALNSETNEIYMTWTQFDAYNSKDPQDSSIIVFSKSSDQGATWSAPKRISFYAGDCLDDDNTVEGAVPAVGPNGEIYVTWTGPKGLVFQKSLDGGETWMSKEKLLEPQFGGWTLKIPGIYRANGLPILKCDPNNGTLYLNWCDQRNGEDDTDVWLMRSRDGGETWSDPIRVNQDDSKRHQFFTWMTLDASSGNLYFVYYDRRNTDGTATETYLSYSTDGGTSFVDVKASKKAFTPDPDLFFGDYLNIDAVDGHVLAIWPILNAKGEIELFVGKTTADRLLD
ncbi:MAG: hypothetical protein Crog4KO_05080 [Crocinitomicaceae bacterium]